MGYRSLPNKIVCELDILQTQAAKNVAVSKYHPAPDTGGFQGFQVK